MVSNSQLPLTIFQSLLKMMWLTKLSMCSHWPSPLVSEPRGVTCAKRRSASSAAMTPSMLQTLLSRPPLLWSPPYLSSSNLLASKCNSLLTLEKPLYDISIPRDDRHKLAHDNQVASAPALGTHSGPRPASVRAIAPSKFDRRPTSGRAIRQCLISVEFYWGQGQFEDPVIKVLSQLKSHAANWRDSTLKAAFRNSFSNIPREVFKALWGNCGYEGGGSQKPHFNPVGFSEC